MIIDEIHAVIANGVLAKGMPAWAKQLKPEEIDLIVGEVNAPGADRDADAALWSLSHHPRPAVHDLAGQVDILDVDDDVVLARVDLASAGSDWRLSGRYRFTTAQGRVVTCVEPQPPSPTAPPKEKP